MALLFFAAIAFLLATIFLWHKKMPSNGLPTDPITGGWNPSRFEAEASRTLRSAPPGTYTFLALNIAKFKLINDTFGMQKGNQTLKYVYDVLASCLNEGELLCRSSSDHFDLLVNSQSPEEMTKRLEQICYRINAFNDQREQKYFLTLTVGIYPITDPQLTVSRIRDRADGARKSSGPASGNHLYSCAFYSALQQQRQMREKDMENKMISALNANEFLIYLQPKMDLRTNQIVAAEALVRWLDRDWGLIPPDEFIPFFEKNGFVVSLDLCVFEQVCRLIRRWIDAGATPLPISVNLSYIHLYDENFLQKYIAIQQQWQVPANLLEIELTETMLFENLNTVKRAIDLIHQAGFRCSLDDFGSGYSSLNMLKDIDVDALKLDRAFFRSPQADNPKERAIIQSVVDMAGKLQTVTVAEGVETAAQLSFLRQIHCDMAQGYVISKPLPTDQFEQMVFGRCL